MTITTRITAARLLVHDDGADAQTPSARSLLSYVINTLSTILTILTIIYFYYEICNNGAGAQTPGLRPSNGLGARRGNKALGPAAAGHRFSTVHLISLFNFSFTQQCARTPLFF